VQQDLTLRVVLDLPVLRQAGAEVAAGASRLDRGVRWLHASDLPDVAPLLRPGDLVLTTGSGLPDGPDQAGFRTYAGTLSEAGAAGVIVELGRRWQGELPEAMVLAFTSVDLPLISLAHEVRFAAVTQAVGELIVDSQLAELRDAQQVHEVFTELSFDQAGPDEVLEAVQRLAGATVVVESDQGQVLDYLAGPGDVGAFLADWQVRSARVRIDGRTGWDARNGWLVTRLGPRDRRWGRLVIQSTEPPSQRLVAVGERAAAALALHRLHHRDRDNLQRRTHFELINGLCSTPTSTDVARRCELASFPIARRRFVGMTLRSVLAGDGRVRPRTATDEVITAAVRGCAEHKLPALICEVEGDVRVLLSLPERGNARKAVDRLGLDVARHQTVIVGVGREAPDVNAIDRSLSESRQVVDALGSEVDPTDVHRLEDVHVRGLVALLGDDDRLALFVARELEPLLKHDADSNLGLYEAVRALLWFPSSKTDAAASVHISRPAFYARLEKAEQVLGVDLGDPTIRLSLHLAMLASEVRSQT
jgi:PucR family transcriptional regulator, purine catabolism regulatory protein